MIYVNGCSFTYGDELSDRYMAWPYLLAEKLQTKVFNDATSGGTNYRNVYSTLKNLRYNYDLYIIAWTSTTRYTFYKSDNNYEINFNPQLDNGIYSNELFFNQWGKTLYKHWHNELFALKLWLQQIMQLQAILEKNKKKYFMINTFPNNLFQWLSPKDKFIESVKSLINLHIMHDEQIFAEYQEIQYYVECINKETFYKWNQFTISDLATDFPKGPGGHMLEDGHNHLASLLVQYVQCLK